MERRVALLIAVAALGTALLVHEPARGPQAYEVLLLVVAMLAAAAALLMPPKRGSAPLPGRAGGALVTLQFVTLLAMPPSISLLERGRSTLPLYWGLVLAMGLCAALLLTGRRRWLWPTLALHLATSLWLFWATPRPVIDVDVFHRDAIARLLEGGNPYDMTFPDIYSQKTGRPPDFYPQHFIRDGRIQFGFPYPPLSLMLTVPGHLAGDHRLVFAVAVVVAAGLMAHLPNARAGALGAVLLLTMPRLPHVLEMSWTEPLAVMLLAAVVICTARGIRGPALAAGLLLAVKQYTILLVPLFVLLLPGKWRWGRVSRFYAIACATAAAVTLPLVLWNIPAAHHSLVEFQTQAAFRADSLSLVAWLGHYAAWWRDAAGWLPWVMLLPLYALILWKAPRGPTSFAIATGLVLLVFFAFGKQAFVNYYFLAMAAMCIGISADEECGPIVTRVCNPC